MYTGSLQSKCLFNFWTYNCSTSSHFMKYSAYDVYGVVSVNQPGTNSTWYQQRELAVRRTHYSMRVRTTQHMWRLVYPFECIYVYTYGMIIIGWCVCILRCILEYRNICVYNMADPPKGKDSLMKLLLSTTPVNTAVPSIPVSALQVSYFVLFNSHTWVSYPWLLCLVADMFHIRLNLTQFDLMWYEW